MKSLSLTIVTPTLNSAATLRATLDSVRPLVYAGAEHIVVDSSSSDETVDLAKASGARVIQFPKGNMYAAINAGMALGRGDWLTYINGDDLLYADAALEALNAYGQTADIIYGNLDYIDEQGRFLFSRRSPEPRHLRWLMRHYCPFPQQGTLFRKSVYDSMCGFDTRFRFAADYDYFSRCCLAEKRFQKYTVKSIAAFRVLSTQMSQRLRGEMAPEGLLIRRELFASPGVKWPRLFATLYRWATNWDGILLRWQRGRNQDAGWRS